VTYGGTATTILRDHAQPSKQCPRCSTVVAPNMILCWPCHEAMYGEDHTKFNNYTGPATIPPEPVTIAETTDKAADLLDEAKKIVTGARRQTYGAPEDNFRVIADLWATYLRRTHAGHITGVLRVEAKDVAQMMILMKVARLAESPDHHDSVVDIAGYAACAARLQK
jgi:hypothetical protein